MELIPIKTIWTIIRYFPGWMMRWYFNKERLSSLVYIDLRPRYDSVTINLGDNPEFYVYLMIINLTPIDIELDRGSFQLVSGGINLKSYILEKKTIHSGEIGSLYLNGALSDGQANSITKDSGNEFSLEGNIEFNSKIFNFAKNIGSLPGIYPKLLNPNARKES